MAYGYIYSITNKINGKKYIGLTTRTVNKRFQEHTKTDSYIGNAIRKYGAENFQLDILDDAYTIEELFNNEIYWIKKYDTFENGYNQTNGGEGVKQEYVVDVTLNKKQERFIDYVERQNKEDIDVGDSLQSIKSILINMMEIYLKAERLSDKKRAAKLIHKLKPKFKKNIIETNTIDFKELNSYL